MRVHDREGRNDVTLMGPSKITFDIYQFNERKEIIYFSTTSIDGIGIRSEKLTKKKEKICIIGQFNDDTATVEELSEHSLIQ